MKLNQSAQRNKKKTDTPVTTFLIQKHMTPTIFRVKYGKGLHLFILQLHENSTKEREEIYRL